MLVFAVMFLDYVIQSKIGPTPPVALRLPRLELARIGLPSLIASRKDLLFSSWMRCFDNAIDLRKIRGDAPGFAGMRCACPSFRTASSQATGQIAAANS
jgi:hypothetical protein